MRQPDLRDRLLSCAEFGNNARWAHAAEVPASGVYRRSTGALVMELSNTSASRPVAVAHVVGALTSRRAGRSTLIHWLVQPGDAEPDFKTWQLQRPPRLFMSDGSEPRHATLGDSMIARARDLAPSEEAVPPGWVTVTL